jgi:sigma-B regulation protein RsbU (phosphoserine phosphatase)
MENLSKVTAEKERIATELNVANKIQAAMLPNVEPDFSNKKEFDLAVNMTPAKEVGGDFYDFYMLDDNHLAITVADVSGKGVGAALFMAISKSILRNNAKLASSAYSEGREPNLGSIIVQTNLQFIENNDEAMFVTLLFGVLDLRNGEFAYINAGHKTPLVRHKENGEFTFIRNVKKSGIIGFSPTVKYLENRLTLKPGDMLFLYTDGITEALNIKREMFGENRLKSSLDTIKEGSKAKEMLLTAFNAVNNFVGDAEQYDDITMLGLIYKKAG